MWQRHCSCRGPHKGSGHSKCPARWGGGLDCHSPPSKACPGQMGPSLRSCTPTPAAQAGACSAACSSHHRPGWHLGRSPAALWHWAGKHWKWGSRPTPGQSCKGPAQCRGRHTRGIKCEEKMGVEILGGKKTHTSFFIIQGVGRVQKTISRRPLNQRMK